MSPFAQDREQITERELELLIEEAKKKLKARSENEVCRYLPGEEGGYMHHFTYRKLKHLDRSLLAKLLKEQIIHPESPEPLPAKPRAARGSRKRRDQLVFTKNDIEKLLHMARMTGDKDMIRKLTPKKDLRSIKRELISSIRHGRIEPDLWNAYVEAVTNQNSYASQIPSLNGSANQG